MDTLFLVSSSIVSLRSKILQRCARRYLKCGVANCPFTPHAYFYTFAKCSVLSQVNRKTAQVRCSYSYYFLHFSSSGVIKYRLVIKIIVLASAREWPSAGGTRTKQLFCGDMSIVAVGRGIHVKAQRREMRPLGLIEQNSTESRQRF